MLHIQNIHAQCDDKKIINGISLRVGKGEIHAILGPNGAGKSTLGHILLGNPKFEVTQGDIEFEGVSWNTLEPWERARQGFFLSFQSPPTLEGVHTKEFLFGAKKSIDSSFHSSFRFQKTIDTYLQSMHLDPSFKTRELNKGTSGGEKKKLEIVSMLALEPKLAFLDEIDSGIDVDALKNIAQNISEFMKSGEKSIIIITHTEKLLSLIHPTHVHILKDGVFEKSGGKELIEEVHTHGFNRS